MKEEITLNTKDLSEEERRVLESSFAFECCTGYNLTGAKQYRFPKEQLISELSKGLDKIEKGIFEVRKNSMIGQLIVGIGTMLVAGIVSTMISNPWLVISLATFGMLAAELIIKKKEKKKIANLKAEENIKMALLKKVNDVSQKEQAKEKSALKEKEALNENKVNKIQDINQEKGNISLEVNASSDVIAQADNTARNISNNTVSAKTETVAKEQESPKQMIKGKNN